MSPVMLLVNDAVPVPSVVFESPVVGLPERFQHTPFAVITPLLSDAMLLPPLVAVVPAIFVSAVVAGAEGRDTVAVVPEMKIFLFGKYLLAEPAHGYIRIDNV